MMSITSCEPSWAVLWTALVMTHGTPGECAATRCQTFLMLKENKTFWSKVYRTPVAKEQVLFLAASLLCPRETFAWLCCDRAPAGRSGPCVQELTVLRSDASSTQIIKPLLSAFLFIYFFSQFLSVTLKLKEVFCQGFYI